MTKENGSSFIPRRRARPLSQQFFVHSHPVAGEHSWKPGVAALDVSAAAIIRGGWLSGSAAHFSSAAAAEEKPRRLAASAADGFKLLTLGNAR
jgi:hypothetical protein